MDTSPDTEIESSIIDSSVKSEEDEPLDPRVQIELERLNHANEAINHLELQLDDARKTFKELRNASITELAQLEKSIGSSVSKTQSYYDARIKLRDVKEILTKTKHRFERAQALHLAAKELAIVSIDHIDEAEKSSENAATWNETYRHALAQAGEAEREKYQADLDQQRAERVYADLETTIEKLQKEFRRSINKSKPYYETKAEHHKELEFHKRKVSGLENCVNEAKNQYQQSLRNLERISNEIHQNRNQGKISEDLPEQALTPHDEEIPEAKTPTPKTVPSNHSDSTIHSCLLRTESLPPGIILNSHIHYLPASDERRDDLTNQFILRAKEAPHPIVETNSEQDLTLPRERSLSFSSQISHITDDSDGKTGSLHALTDEQLDHLAYDYHSYSSELSYPTDPIDEIILQLEHSTLQAKTFFRRLFQTNSIKNN